MRSTNISARIVILKDLRTNRLTDNPDDVYGFGARFYLKAEVEGKIQEILNGSLNK
ncbi:MAG: hypothetical protein KBF93_03710 [Leptospiraceae bacterium]|nr:hypothetical protein [Leptospiraceae bacterium]